MKRTVKFLTGCLIAILTMSMMLVPFSVSADDENTEETTEATTEETVAETDTETVTEADTTPALPKLEHANVINVWKEETMRSLFSNGNQTEISFSDEGLVLTWVPSEGADPYFVFPIFNYYKKVQDSAPSPSQANYVVFKIKATGCDGNFELFTNQPAAGDSSTASYAGNGEWEYIIVDMSLTTLVEAKKLTTMRIDWSAGDTQEGATMTIGEIGFFEEYDDALAFTGVDITVTDPPATKAPVTEAPTDPVTEAPTAEETEAPTSGGCSSVVSVGAGMILVAAAAAVALKRRSI